MAIGLVKDDGSVFIEIESGGEGQYQAEQSGAAAAEVLSDGLEFTPTKELLERNTRTSTVETVVSRVGQKSMAGTVPVEFKAAATEGAEPETGKLYEALLGGKDSLVEVTSDTGHTTTRIYVPDVSQFKAGHIVKIKQSEIAGEDHVSPIAEITDGSGLVGGNAVSFSIGGVTFQAVAANATSWADYNTYVPVGTLTQGGVLREVQITGLGYTAQTFIDLYNSENTGYEFEIISGSPSTDLDPFAGQTFSWAADGANATVSPDFIELLIPYSTSFSDNVKIAASTQYYHKSGAPTLSVTNYLGGSIREKAIGMRPVSAELSSFSTGALPEFSFSLEGLDFDREVGTPLFSPEYDSQAGAEPPVILCSKVYKDATEIEVNEVGISISNTLGFLTSTASCSGKIKSRITKISCGFTIDPYMMDDNTDLFDIFEANTGFSLFGSANNYGATNDEKEQVVAFYMPNCRIPEITTGDADGILTDAINGTAHRDKGNDTIFIAFI